MKLHRAVFALVLSPLLVTAAPNVTLSWQRATNHEASITFCLYAATNNVNVTNFAANAFRISTGTNCTVQLSNLVAGTWYFAATAVNTNGIESDFSNVLVARVPPAPSQMLTLISLYSATITNLGDMREMGVFSIRIVNP